MMRRTSRVVIGTGGKHQPFVRYTGRSAGVKAARRAHTFATIACLLACVLSSSSGLASAQEAPADNSGRVVFINRIHIVGNDNVSTNELRARMRTKEPSFFSILRKPKFNPGQIERDAANLAAYYHSIGYPEATVTVAPPVYLENGRFVDITLRVVEGEPTRVGSVTFTGPLVLEEEELREDLLLEPGAPYNASLLKTDVYRIKSKYFDEGYLGVVIEDSVRAVERRVDIVFHINPGEPLYVGQITIDGNDEVRRSVIEAEIEVEPGDLCRFEKVVKTQRNLFETGLFNVVDVVPKNVDPAARTVDIHVHVRERKGSWIETGFGVGNVLGSRVFAEWGTRNLAGTGRTLRLKTEYAFDLFEGDEIDFDKFDPANTYYRYDAVFQQRRVFGIKLRAGVNAFIEDDQTVPDLSVKTLGTTFAVARNFGKPRPDFGYDSELVASFSIENITRRQLGLPEEHSRSNILGSSLSRDTRDFVLNPRRGGYRIVSGEVAGGILGGENDFYTLTANDQRYRTVGSSVVAWRARVGYADSYGRSPNVPVENRYFLGGANSVRGYDEASLGPRTTEGTQTSVDGGAFMLLANVEFRYPLPFFGRWNFGGAFFVDGGNVWAEASDVTASDFHLTSEVPETNVDDFRYGIGVGLRYNTPVGPIRVDYGYPLKPDLFTDTHGTFYLSLGQIF